MSRHTVSLVKAPLLAGALLLASSPVFAGAGWQTPQTPPPPLRVSTTAPAVVRPAPARWTVSVTVGPVAGSAAAPQAVVLHPGESMTISWQQPATAPHATASRNHTPAALH